MLNQKLIQIGERQLASRKRGCHAAFVAAVLLFTIFVFVAVCFALQQAKQRLTVQLPLWVSKLFGLDITQLQTRNWKLALLTTTGFLLLSAILFQKNAERVDTTTIQEWL